MFEKEAERNAHEHFDNIIMVGAYETGFIDGAEYGYNKANEWHYVKKGEYPIENAMILLARETVNGVQALIGYYRNNQFEIFNEKSCKMQSIDSIYAWKEIVLPKEIE